MQYILDGSAILIAAIIIIICAKKGLFLTVLSFFKVVLATVAAYLWGGKLGDWLGVKFINQPVYDSIFKKFSEIYESATESFSAESVMNSIPKFLQTESMTEKLESIDASGMELVEQLSKIVSETLANVICTILGAVAVFLIAMVALTLIYVIIKAVKKHVKLLGFADGFLGALLGCLLSCFVLLLFSSLMKLFFGTSEGYANSVIVKFFGEATLNDIFKWLNINNWIDKLNA